MNQQIIKSIIQQITQSLNHQSPIKNHKSQMPLVYRMESVHPAERMPEIGRTLVHEAAVELIQEWIEKIESENENSK